MTKLAKNIWKLVNETNQHGKSEIDYLISEEKNIFERKDLKNTKKMFSVSQKTIALIDDATLIKLIESKVFLKALLTMQSNEREEQKQ